MAQQSVTTVVDDLDDTVPAEETVLFALDGVCFEIDLSAAHAASMRADLDFWVTHARRTLGGVPARRSPTRGGVQTAVSPRTGTRTTADREQTAAVRVWARSHGYPVSDRGRIPTAVREAFDAAY